MTKSGVYSLTPNFGRSHSRKLLVMVGISPDGLRGVLSNFIATLVLSCRRSGRAADGVQIGYQRMSDGVLGRKLRNAPELYCTPIVICDVASAISMGSRRCSLTTWHLK